MKVLLINGSRRENGCTFTALSEIAKVLNSASIETQILHVGKKSVNGEINEIVQEAVEAMRTADALIVGSPVYYASPSGEIIAFMDRFTSAAGSSLCHKPAASITSARRAGTTATLDVINKYFSYSQMPIVSSNYWNMVHGGNSEDVSHDLEGMQIMQILAKNMAWLLKCIEAGHNQGIEPPAHEQKVMTSFIR